MVFILTQLWQGLSSEKMKRLHGILIGCKHLHTGNLNKNANQIYCVSKILKILFTLFRSTCFGHHCVHHQELLSCTCSLWSRVVLGSLCPSVLLCCNCCVLQSCCVVTALCPPVLLCCNCVVSFSPAVLQLLCPPVLLCCN